MNVDFHNCEPERSALVVSIDGRQATEVELGVLAGALNNLNLAIGPRSVTTNPAVAPPAMLAALERVIDRYKSAAGGINFPLNALREAQEEMLNALRQPPDHPESSP